MTQEIMSLTKALLEIKTIGKRIEKKTHSSLFIDCYQGKDKLKGASISHLPIMTFEKDAKAAYQSILGLIKRRTLIKAALSQANATVNVTVNDKRYSIASAIEFKKSIQYQRDLLARLRAQYSNMKNHLDVNKLKVEEKVDTMILQSLGVKKENADEKEYAELTTPFLDANTLYMIDPLNLKDKIEKLDDYIDGFEGEVDCALSEINSRTEITIDTDK